MRIYWIDNAKAIGIILIVFGHTHCLGEFSTAFIYSFHVPLFFFISGFLLKEASLAIDFKTYFQKYFKRIIIPYAIFGLLSYMVWMPSISLRKQAEEYATLTFYDPLLGLLYGSYDYIYVNAPLWYFTCLFSTLILIYFVFKLRKKSLIGLIIILLGIIGPTIHQYINFRFPWNMELAMVAIVFLGAGLLSNKIDLVKGKISLNKRFFTLLILLSASIMIVLQNGGVNMNSMIFGNSFLFYIGAFCGISFVLIISYSIPRNSISQWLSINSLIIFAFHKIVLNIITGIGLIFFNLDYVIDKNIIIGSLSTFGAIIGCLPVSLVINKWAPWVIGQTRESQFVKTLQKGNTLFHL